jgi:hypothetical protein
MQDDGIDITKMPREEVRLRLDSARRIYPLEQISKRTGIAPNKLRQFIRNEPVGFGAPRIQRIARVCIDIEIGRLRWNGKTTKGSKTWEDVPNKKPTIVHRVIFGRAGVAPKLEKGEAPQIGSMPSFAELFDSKPVYDLQKLINKS